MLACPGMSDTMACENIYERSFKKIIARLCFNTNHGVHDPEILPTSVLATAAQNVVEEMSTAFDGKNENSKGQLQERWEDTART